MRIVMMGTGLFAEPTFEALLAGPHPVVGLVTQPDRAVGQERGSTRQTGKGMKAIAQEKGEYQSDAEIEKRLKEQAEGNGPPPIM